jgi:hypothetical protein
MVKYSTKYFGDFEAGETDNEIIIDSKLNLTGKIKDVSILMTHVNTYFLKINTCIKMLNKYPKLYKIGKKEIIKNYGKNKDVRNFIDKCLVKHIEEGTGEKIIGINIDNIMKRLGPPSIVFNNNNGEIILALGYQIIDGLDEVIIIEINEKYKIKGVKYYK